MGKSRTILQGLMPVSGAGPGRAGDRGREGGGPRGQAVDPRRVRLLASGEAGKGGVLYWMSRDQRIRDNWALLFAQDLAFERKAPLAVAFCLARRFLEAGLRQYQFMMEGLKQVERDLAEKNIPFFLVHGNPGRTIPDFIRRRSIGALITDFDPLRIKREWKDEVRRKIDIPFFEVDAHNIIPCWAASDKQEYAAYTFRPKVIKKIQGYLEDYPPLRSHAHAGDTAVSGVDWEKALATVRADQDVPPIGWLAPGEQGARLNLEEFIEGRLNRYHTDKNDPNADGVSQLSAYLHFGQISAQRIVLEVLRTDGDWDAMQSFLEELIVRRELSDNFCFYNTHYDDTECFPRWARDTLMAHSRDRREYLYTREQLEAGGTHDPLWNAAQCQMVLRGTMHGYMRMYWAKKILEWSESPEAALAAALYLNDRYELDGRDPNGYAGMAWSIGGVHDRPWFDRPIFGKIRYMSSGGCRSKFDVDRYIKTVERYG